MERLEPLNLTLNTHRRFLAQILVSQFELKALLELFALMLF